MKNTVRVMGLKEAEEYLEELQGGVQTLGKAAVQVGTNVEYAWGVEFGQRRDGKRARKAGGSFALSDAFQDVKPRIGQELLKALPKGPRAVLTAMKLLGVDILRLTKENLKSRVYGDAIPTRLQFEHSITKRGKLRLKVVNKPLWRRTGNLRRSYHMEVQGTATSSYLRSAYYKAGEPGS